MARDSFDARAVIALNRLATSSRDSRIATRLIATYLPVLMVAVFFAFCLAHFTFVLGSEWFMKALIAAVVARLIGTVIRLFVRRPRPHRVLHLSPLIRQKSLSFPSGHALFFSAFSIVVLAASFPLGIAFLAATVFVCIARVACGIHYPSDMALGFVIGILTGLALLHFY